MSIASILATALTVSTDNLQSEISQTESLVITPEMFSEMEFSEYMDQIPVHVSFAPKGEYRSSNVVVAKFPVRVGMVNGEACFLPSQKSIYGAQKRLTQASAMTQTPFGDNLGPCRVNADLATLLRLEHDEEVGAFAVPFYAQKAYDPSVVEGRGFSVKFTEHNTFGLPREEQAEVNAFRARLAQGVLSLKEKLGLMGQGSLLITLVGFCGTPQNITRSKSKDLLRDEKDKYGDRANDLCVGVSFPSGGFILAAQPLEVSENLGFQAHRISATSQSSYRQQVLAAMKRNSLKARPQFVPDAAASAPKAVAVIKAPAPKTTAVIKATEPKPVVNKATEDRLISIGKYVAGLENPNQQLIYELKLLIVEVRKGQKLTESLVASIAPSIGGVSGLKKLEDKSRTPAPAPKVEAPAPKASLLSLMKSSGSMTDESDFQSEENISVPEPTGTDSSVSSDSEEIPVTYITGW
jgi:hypothetical protein